MKDYSELKMLAEAATPGEWTSSEKHDGRFWHISSGNQAIGATHAESKKSVMAGTFEANAKFIAKANPEKVLELIAEVESLKKDAARYRWLIKNGELIPEFDGNDWVVIYLDNGAGGFGGGVCDARFTTFCEAIDFSMSKKS